MPRRAAARHSAGTCTPSRVRASAASHGASPAAAPRTPTPPPRTMFRLLISLFTPTMAPHQRSVRSIPGRSSRAITRDGPTMQNDLHLGGTLIPATGSPKSKIGGRREQHRPAPGRQGEAGRVLVVGDAQRGQAEAGGRRATAGSFVVGGEVV